MLIIALPLKAQANPVYSYWLSPNGVSLNPGAQASAANLPKQAGEVVAIIPWSLVSWHTVKLPPMSQLAQPSSAKMSAVINALLENEVLDDLASLHLILPAQLRTPKMPGLTGSPLSRELTIGVCSLAWMREVSAPLQEQGIRVQRIVCELTPSQVLGFKDPSPALEQGPRPGSKPERTQQSPQNPVLYILDDVHSQQTATAQIQATAVLCTTQGVQRLPPSPAEWTAFKALADPSLKILCEPQWANSSAAALGREPILFTQGQRILQALQSPWDAATGEWAQSRSLRLARSVQRNFNTLVYDPRWSKARVGAASLIAVNLIALNAWAWIQSAQLRSREAEFTALLKETFPSIGLVVQPSLQMQREMTKIKHSRGQSANGDLETMLAVIAPHLPSTFKAVSLNYSVNELRLFGVSKDSVSKASEAALQKTGYRVRFENTTQGGQTVSVLILNYADGVQ